MSHFLFIDESGQDGQAAPYEVLAGVAIEDKELWNLIQRIHDLERDIFGRRISEGALELKAKKLLKRKTFRIANQADAIPPDERLALVESCLRRGQSDDIAEQQNVTRNELTALGQAKIDFVSSLLELCAQHRAHAFASIIPNDIPRPQGSGYLRKDYAFLFERFFYYLDDLRETDMGIVVFDELEKTRCHLLVGQMEEYFLKTTKGRMRAAKIIPEPFFVHSDLTTAVQLADLVAYIISWGVQVGSMKPPARPELRGLADRVCQLRHRAVREMQGRSDFVVWSFAVIDELRLKADLEE